MNRKSLVLISFALFLLTACQTEKPVNAPKSNNNSATPDSTPDQFAATRTLY
jgi:outer membrane biogenesis lipoprotein LolB